MLITQSNMASRLKNITMLPRVSVPGACLSKQTLASIHTRACAANVAVLSASASQMTPTIKTCFYSSTALRSWKTLSQKSHMPLSLIPRTQLRFNSNTATVVTTTDNTSLTSLKVHNPQYDESGNELTVDITEKAVKQLKHIAARDQNPMQALRITVDSGGCHGYQYLMDLTDTVNEDDVIFEKDGARVVIDTITLPMISGSKIDFIEELIGSAFKVLANPHAAHSCGCDTSFEIKI